MSTTMSKIKNHPGFMPFGHANTKSGSKDTQSKREDLASKKEIASDSNKGK